ncbi:unnamed protein product [Adineta ricciae]|uniref:SH2 domain-containing protein n=1 Tax=Adineta ricciae TaxID=249248 RepID=A0A814NCE9_ADIRI|nr:unnamed protein product [Adineta ricciae]
MALYVTQNERDSTQLTVNPWFVGTCSNRHDAGRILESCRTIENGNFLVRKSENSDTQYAITLWFDKQVTHVRINQVDGKQYQLEYNSNANLSVPVFPTIEGLIKFYTEHEMKLTGHCQGFVKLKFNPNLFKD